MSANQSKLPAGYLPVALPFHEKLDSAEFEQFCTDLLNLHPEIYCLRDGDIAPRKIVTASRLLSGTAQNGADIRAKDDQGGVWVFQCKCVTSFGRADVEKAIKLAEAGSPHSDEFVLITTCALSDDSQKLLNERPKWHWWDSSRLTTETVKLRPREDAMNLVHRYFPDRVKRTFVFSDQPLLKWEDFFKVDLSPDRKHFHHRATFLDRPNEMAQLESFARSGVRNALILSAAGGQGKSRLLLELARNLEKHPGAPQVRFLNINRIGLTETQFDFLAQVKEPLLLVVDDAHRLEGVIQQIARATSQAEQIRLMIVTRPQATESVWSQLCRGGYEERLGQPVHLSKWTSQQIHLLAERVLDPEHRFQASRLATLADKCPLLVILGAAQVNSGAWPELMTNEQTFQDRVFKGFIDDFLKCQPAADRKRIDRLVRFLSFVSPAQKNQRLFEVASGVIGCLPLDVAEDIEMLIGAGMAVENREGVRLYPDLFADAVVLEASLRGGGQPSELWRAIVDKLPLLEFPTLLRNLAQADWEARAKKKVRCSLFEPLWTEFVKLFEAGMWVDYGSNITLQILELRGYGEDKPPRKDRAELIRRWAAVAIYLPEKTIELAKLALKSVDGPYLELVGEPPADNRAVVVKSLPSILRPIVIYHPGTPEADNALDLLWLMDAATTEQNQSKSSESIAAIADAGSLGVNRPHGLECPRKVIEWFDRKTRDPVALERIRQEPWILGAILKPFFGRAVEHLWTMGNSINSRIWPVSAEKTRPLRQMALAITRRLLDTGDAALGTAAISVIKEALNPVQRHLGSEGGIVNVQEWRADRLEVIGIINDAIKNHKDNPLLLLQLWRILRTRCKFESDEIVRAECKRLFDNCPNTFGLRVGRVLTSYAIDEIGRRSGPVNQTKMAEIESEWRKFVDSVALEAVVYFGTAAELCVFISDWIPKLKAADMPLRAGALLESAATLSANWCASILAELLNGKERDLDGFLYSVLPLAAAAVPNDYAKAVEFLPHNGGSELLRSFISYLGWKHLYGGGLSDSERTALVQSGSRSGESIGITLASVAGFHLANEPELAMRILVQIKPVSEGGAHGILEAVANLAREHKEALTDGQVSLCFDNIGSLFCADGEMFLHELTEVAKSHSRPVYSHVLKLCELDAAGLVRRSLFPLLDALTLGPIDDAHFIDGELRGLWQKAISVDLGSDNQFRWLALMRALIWSAPAVARYRIQRIIENCASAGELTTAAELVATTGSRFVFRYPEFVRLLLARGVELGVAESISERLMTSARGGPRSFVDNELEPEFHYILKESESMVERYRDDSILGEFYRSVADSERRHLVLNCIG